MSFGADRVKVTLTREKFEELTKNLLERTITFTEEMIQRSKEKGHARIDKLLLVGGSTFMPQVTERLKAFNIEVLQKDPNQIVARGAAVLGKEESGYGVAEGK